MVSSRLPWVLTVLAAAGAKAGPCDIYGHAGTPCAAAHSVVRALFSGYSAKLYQVGSQ